MSKVVVGGTFNVLHKGHIKLLSDAVDIATLKGAMLMVGITSDELAQRTRTVPVRPRKERMADVQDYIEKHVLRPHFGPTQYEIIRDVNYMPVMKNDDTLVVSEETAMHAFEILADKGYGCAVHVIDMVKDKDGNEIHSTKILEEIENEIQ